MDYTLIYRERSTHINQLNRIVGMRLNVCGLARCRAGVGVSRRAGRPCIIAAAFRGCC